MVREIAEERWLTIRCTLQQHSPLAYPASQHLLRRCETPGCEQHFLSVISIIRIFVTSNIRPEQRVPLAPPPLAHVEDRCPLDSLAEKQLGSLTVTTALPLSASAAKDSVTSVLVRLGRCQQRCTNCSSLNAPSASGKQGETGWRNRCCLLANVET